MSNKTSTITILQLTRFGDLIQSLWAIKGLRESNPNLKLNLVARKRFGAPLMFLLSKSFDHILLLDEDIFSGQDTTQGLDSVLSEIDSWNSSVLINFSFSKSSAYLSSLISANFKLGLTSNEFGGNQVNGSWSEYIYSTVMRGPLNPFSLIDIFRFIIGSTNKPLLPETSITGDTIVIHPFASQERKVWSGSKWSEIIFKVLKKNPEIKVMIVGSALDLSSAHEITSNPILLSYRERILTNCGSLSLEQLYTKLQEAFLFCGHDSMVGHLASLTGTQCLTLSLGSVRPSETSPYGLNNYTLAPKTPCFPCFPDEACAEFTCHKDLSYQVVSDCIQQLIDTTEIKYQEIKKTISPLHLSNTSLYQSSFSENGIFQLQNLSPCSSTTNDLYNTFYKIVWLFLLEDIEEISQYPELNNTSLNSLEAFIPNLRQLFELAEFGKKYSKYILDEVSKPEPNVEYIKSCGSKIEEIDNLQVMLGKSSPALCPIVDFYNLKKSKMEGSNLVELCSSSYEIYQSIATFCDILYELIEKSLNEYKIKNKTATMKEAKE